MAMGILITAVLVFAVRGMFLGFTGVIARTAGIICGYFVAYSYRHQLSELVTTHTNISVPGMVIEVISGFILFFGAMIVCSLIVAGLFRGMAAFVPGLKTLTDKESLASKCAGAITNSALAVVIVLSGTWGYGMATGKVDHSDPLQHYANRFGGKVFSVVKENSNFTLPDFDRSAPQHSPTKGTAIIRSESNPEKTLSIDSTPNIIGAIRDNNTEQAIPNSEHIEQLLNNEQLRDMAQKQMEANPELLQEVLANPQLQSLLEFLQKRQNTPEILE